MIIILMIVAMSERRGLLDLIKRDLRVLYFHEIHYSVVIILAYHCYSFSCVVIENNYISGVK